MNDIKEYINKHWDAIRRHRIWLHLHPEASGKEKMTPAYIAKVLREMGLEPQENVGGNGVVAVIEGKGEGKCVGLRADFDALEVAEVSDFPYPSHIPGMMHACGHDAHTAMLLGAAYVLNDLRDTFSGKAKLIFQPSEENVADSGARRMIQDGCLENPHVDAIFGQHVWPEFPVGKVAVRNGIMMAASDQIRIKIYGKKSHASKPESGIDAIVIASYVVTALQTVVARSVAPLDSSVVTIGKIDGGSRYNVLADEVDMLGTCRNLDHVTREEMPRHIESILKGIVDGMGGTYDFEFVKGYSPTVNDPKMFDIVCQAVTEEFGKDSLVIPEHPALTGEDFSFYGEKVPSAFFWLGCSNPNKPTYPLHHGAFYPEWEALPVGIETMVTAARDFLNSAAKSDETDVPVVEPMKQTRSA